MALTPPAWPRRDFRQSPVGRTVCAAIDRPQHGFEPKAFLWGEPAVRANLFAFEEIQQPPNCPVTGASTIVQSGYNTERIFGKASVLKQKMDGFQPFSEDGMHPIRALAGDPAAEGLNCEKAGFVRSKAGFRFSQDDLRLIGSRLPVNGFIQSRQFRTCCETKSPSERGAMRPSRQETSLRLSGLRTR